MTELIEMLGISRSHIIGIRGRGTIPRKYIQDLEVVPFEEQRTAPVSRQYGFRWLNAVGEE